MDWLYLISAGLFEVIGVIGIKKTAEKNNWLNNTILIVGFIISFQLLLKAMESIPLATAYAVWTGVGTVGATIIGIIFFKEPKSWLRIACILGVIFFVIGLKVVH